MRRLVYLLSVAVIALATAVVPLPLLVLAPAPATPVSDAIEVTGDPGEVNGAWLLTTVSVRQPTIADAVQASVDPYEDVRYREQVIPPDIDEQEFFRTQREIFDESVQIAAAVGLREAGLDVTVSGDGANVVRVIPGSPADGALQEGDVIVEADGRQVNLAAELQAITTAKAAGDEVRLAVLRDGTRQPVSIEVGTIPGSDQVGVGVLVDTANQRIDLPEGIEVNNASNIGGPSAGLLLALTTYDLFAEQDLAAGRRIAGTGTVTLSGQVGPISGVEEKVRGALSSDADVFLAPAIQADAARSAADDELEVIAVTTIEDAIAALGG